MKKQKQEKEQAQEQGQAREQWQDTATFNSATIRAD